MNHYNHKDVADDCEVLLTVVFTFFILSSIIGAIIVCL